MQQSPLTMENIWFYVFIDGIGLYGMLYSDSY